MDTLRIHKTNESDAGIYMCEMFNYSANSTLEFHWAIQARELLERKQDYIINHCSQLEVEHLAQQLLEILFTLTAPPSFIDGIQPIRVFVTSNWTICSHSCGGAGLQSREVSCEMIYIVSDQNCAEVGWQKPIQYQDCGYVPCPSWRPTEWAPVR